MSAGIIYIGAADGMFNFLSVVLLIKNALAGGIGHKSLSEIR
jgi:hypothetical protein